MQTTNINIFGKKVKSWLAWNTYFRIPLNRWGELISYSWLLVPDYMNSTFSYLKNSITKAKSIKNITDILALLIIDSLNKGKADIEET